VASNDHRTQKNPSVPADYNYDRQFGLLLEELKVSMVDLYMVDKYGIEEIYDDMYILPDEKGSVTRPQVYGDRGGAFTLDYASAGESLGESLFGDPNKFVYEFDDVRSEINRITERWRSIPDPGKIKDAASQINNAFDCFAWKGVNDVPLPNNSSTVNNPGNLMNTLNSIQYEFGGYGDTSDSGYKQPALSGKTADAFMQSLRNINSTFCGFEQVVQALACAVNAQQGFWTRARECVLEILGHVAGACDQAVASCITTRGPGKDEAVLTLSVVGTIVGILAPEEAIVVAGTTVVSLGLSVMGYVESKTTPSSSTISVGEDVVGSTDLAGVTVPQISHYDNALHALGIAFGTVSWYGYGLNLAVITAEKRTKSDIADVVQGLDSHRNLIKLNPEAIESAQDLYRPVGADPARTDTISELMRGFTDQLMQIQGYVYGASDTGIGFPPRSVLHRDPDIGIGADGPADELTEVLGLVGAALDQLNWEIVEVRENFDAAVAVLDRANSTNIATLRQTAAEIEQGYPSGYYGVDDFDYKKYEQK